MPKEELVESRFGWMGGLNTTLSPELLGVDELVTAQNVRLDAATGALGKRTGSRRLHASAVGSGAAIRGAKQWDSPSGSQLVVIANGRLYHRLQSGGEFSAFSEVIPGAGDEFSTTVPAHFAPFRSTSIGGALVLYIASGGKLYTWTGSTLTRIDGTSNAPNALLLAPYHTRLFAVPSDELKTLYWSHIGDGNDWTVVTNDLSSGGGNPVDLLTGETLVALGLVGSSLVCATEDSLVRFTGYSAEDIRVEQDTEGISALHGPVGPLALTQCEEFLAMLSASGVYLVEEAGVRPISGKIEPTLDALDRTALSSAVLGYHRGRRELWVAVQRSGDSGNRSVYVWSARLQAWQGPWTYPFAITCLARYEDPTGDEWLVAGCSDGFLRHMDTGMLDDVLSSGSGGSSYATSSELPPIYFAPGPGVLKSLRHAVVSVDNTASIALAMGIAEDGGGYNDFFVQTVVGAAPVFVALSGQAGWFRIRFSESQSASLPIVRGFQLYAHDMQRPFRAPGGG